MIMNVCILNNDNECVYSDKVNAVYYYVICISKFLQN